ncbi:class I SAM-dependent methyltransferase [Hyphococcus lacteus]|uniref:Class I SAM-dependent methyltransferase n=1 Tax=Hyphococcus lacteus TaxID=3143536 RepID=A0ABV3Z5A8_9PROT
MAPLNTMIANGAKRAAYGASQAARVLWYTGHYAYGRRLMGPLTEPGEAPYAEEFGPLDRDRLKSSFKELFHRDWKNIEAGEYKLPKESRRMPSFRRMLRESRDYLSDAQNVARRKHTRGHSEVLTEAQRAKYPRYYLQNFHYQTDGWLTESSAERYDMQVETLFTGSADAMRRQALPRIRHALSGRDMTDASLLDIGCGVGRFLESVKDNWPVLPVTALDLSPAYLTKAQTRLGRFRDVTFVQGKAEDTQLAAQSYDVITAVYLFHELPPAIRQDVVAECARLLKPGGKMIIVDTIQYGDESGFDILLENFPRGFHEPYYDSYCRTDLSALMDAEGLTKIDETVAFLSKISMFEKLV